MWCAQHSVLTTATREDAWALLCDVAHWCRWNEVIESSGIAGSFSPGCRGEWRLRGNRRAAFRLSLVQEGQGFQAVVERFLGVLCVSWLLEPSALGLKITGRVEARGLLSGFLILRQGRFLARSLPEAVRSLARQASEPRTAA